MRKKVMIGILSLFLAMGMTGCGSEESLQGAPDNEIITTTAVDQKKTMVTVRVEFGAGQQEELEKILEEKFPDVDIVLRHDGSTSSVYTVKANLEAGVECDLILSRRLPVVADVAEDYLLDISSEKFVDNYYMNAVDSCAGTDGKLYYLPGPSDVYGIVYDKTMFEQNGWEVPQSYSEFQKLLKTIAKTDKDITPIQISLMYPDMFQILFNTYGYEDAYRGSDNYVWLSNYQQGEGSMVGHMEKAVEDFKALFDAGMLSVSDLEVTPSERSEMMYQKHSTAMIVECQNALSYARSSSESDGNDAEMHDIAMMPFWVSDEEDGDYLYAIPSYYMAINKSAAQESEKKKEILLEIYDYLSSKEGQEILIGDDFQVSNIMDVSLNSNEFSEGIIHTIERGQIINTFYFASGETDKQVERQMLGTLKDMLLDKMSVKDWLLAADDVRDQYLSGSLGKEKSYGTVDKTMTRLETAYTVAEMYASMMDTPIGICRGGSWSKSTNGYLYQGEITDSSLACITPDKEPQADDEDSDENKIVKTSLTGQQIIDILNDTSELSTTKGLSPYYVAYGLEVEFCPWAEEGKRVLSCKLPSGEELDKDAVYEVAYFNGSLPDTELKAEDALDMTWQEAFVKWLDDKKDGTLKKPEMTLKLVYDE
jgi:ABC-type glycerol-3-phosphate transport system substrate-binding protein